MAGFLGLGAGLGDLLGEVQEADLEVVAPGSQVSTSIMWLHPKRKVLGQPSCAIMLHPWAPLGSLAIQSFCCTSHITLVICNLLILYLTTEALLQG